MKPYKKRYSVGEEVYFFVSTWDGGVFEIKKDVVKEKTYTKIGGRWTNVPVLKNWGEIYDWNQIVPYTNKGLEHMKMIVRRAIKEKIKCLKSEIVAKENKAVELTKSLKKYQSK